MAKLFQLYDPTKDGKGVKKNEPKKKAFFDFFEIYFSNFGKLLTTGLCSLPFSFLILTSGLSNCGLTYVTRNATRRRPYFAVTDFFDAIKKNWKQGLLVGIINAILTALIFFDMYFFYFGQGNEIFVTIGLAVALLIHIVFSGMKYYMYMLMITFDFPLKKLYKNAFNLTFINFGKTLLVEIILLVLYLLPLALYFALGGLAQFAQIMVIVYLFGAFVFFPGFKSFLTSWLTFPVIKKVMIDPYYEKNPDKDIEKRRELGILEEDPEKIEDERIFTD